MREEEEERRGGRGTLLSNERANTMGLRLLGRGKGGGQLVLLGFDVTAFTPAAYQRHRL